MMERIRKFGLEYCDLPTMLWNVSVLLRLLTLNIDKRNTKRIPVFNYILIVVIASGFFYVYLISMVWFLVVKCRETRDMIAATIVFSLGIFSEIGTVKLFYMFRNIDLVKDILQEYLQCDSMVTPGSRFAKNIGKTLRLVKKRAIIFWLVIIGNGFIYCVKPIVLPGRHLMEDSFVYYGLEPMYDSPNYQVAYCLTVFGVMFTCYLPANLTAFLIVIIGYTEAQMLGLSEELTSLWVDAQEYCKKYSINEKVLNRIVSRNKVMNKFIKRKLTEIVKRHAVNINLIRQVEVVFRGAVALEFTLLVIGLIAILLGGLENTYIEMPFALIQVGMDCLIGQRVMDASVVFENAVYDSKWENFDDGNKKTILLMLQISQKTLTLSAGGVTTLSFTSLMAILKSVYSTYTGLRSAVNKK